MNLDWDCLSSCLNIGKATSTDICVEGVGVHEIRKNGSIQPYIWFPPPPSQGLETSGVFVFELEAIPQVAAVPDQLLSEGGLRQNTNHRRQVISDLTSGKQVQVTTVSVYLLGSAALDQVMKV